MAAGQCFHSLRYGSQISHRKRKNAKLDLLNYNALQPKLPINRSLQTWHQILSLFNGSVKVLKLFWNIFSCWSVLLIFFLWDGRKGDEEIRQLSHIMKMWQWYWYDTLKFSLGQLKMRSVNGSLYSLNYRWCCPSHIQYIIVQGLHKVSTLK